MKREIGLWIDHRKAVIVTIEDKNVEIQEIQSEMVKRVRFSGKSQSKGGVQPVGSTAEDIRDRQFGEQLDNYYDTVLAIVKTADSIWIIGPGEAKGELERHIQHAGLGACIVGVEAADKLTNNQIEAKVRDHYLR
ncbi:MAG TPA: hypothetical protein VLR89_00735 [Anaerolineaceae bacterium]|nr:hypothetical protein [Anaerolineaceae bacterium]